jgi:hypothetical protein
VVKGTHNSGNESEGFKGHTILEFSSACGTDLLPFSEIERFANQFKKEAAEVCLVALFKVIK